ncbi:MAG: hypothetical protein LBP50_04850 [Tannerella sp.]|jgi:hypothetical protein|nr:hypothetical protein [Tannerella sp.]
MALLLFIDTQMPPIQPIGADFYFPHGSFPAQSLKFIYQSKNILAHNLKFLAFTDTVLAFSKSSGQDKAQYSEMASASSPAPQPLLLLPGEDIVYLPLPSNADRQVLPGARRRNSSLRVISQFR